VVYSRLTDIATKPVACKLHVPKPCGMPNLRKHGFGFWLWLPATTQQCRAEGMVMPLVAPRTTLYASTTVRHATGLTSNMAAMLLLCQNNTSADDGHCGVVKPKGTACTLHLDKPYAMHNVPRPQRSDATVCGHKQTSPYDLPTQIRPCGISTQLTCNTRSDATVHRMGWECHLLPPM
jgi:hypothetical protein